MNKAATAVKNSIASFQRLLSTHQPTHVLAAFDYGGPTWRHALHRDYQKNATTTPEVLRAELPHLYEALSGMGLTVVSVPEVEADDVIATVVLRWLGESRGPAIVASTDKDLHVLIDQGAILWDHFKSEAHDRAWVEQRFGVGPEMLTDFLALVGDKAHGVPGVQKVGEKTAARLLQSYRSLEGVMNGAGILKDALGERLRNDRDNAFLSRELVSLKTDVWLGLTWKMLARRADPFDHIYDR